MVVGYEGEVRSGAVSDGHSAVCGAVSPCSTGGALHGGHGFVASTVYARGSWPSDIVILQRMHVLCRLFPGSPEVAVVDFCCGVFPQGKVRGVMDSCHPTGLVLLERFM